MDKRIIGLPGLFTGKQNIHLISQPGKDVDKLHVLHASHFRLPDMLCLKTSEFNRLSTETSGSGAVTVYRPY